MPAYAYIARTSAGERVTGTLTGATEHAVLTELQARELAPVQVRRVPDRPRLRRGVSTRVVATAYRQMADLLRAGVPLLRALRLLGRGKSNPRIAGIMAGVADQVADGTRLADAMAAHPDVFPPVQLAMIRAGERGGFLEQVLSRMGMFLEHQADMRARVVGNLIYPVVLLIVGLVIVTFALVGLVPKFEAFYSRIELPLATKILLGASDALTVSWPVILIGTALLIVVGVNLARRPTVRRGLARVQLAAPVLGPLVRSLAVSRFARILGTLLANGVPLLTAMQISRDAAGHVLMQEAIDDATEAVRAGRTLAAPLAESGLFDDDVVEMVAVGESANNLAEVLLTIAETIEKRVDRLLGVLLRLMEPMLLLMLAGMVLFIFVALVVPMLRLSGGV